MTGDRRLEDVVREAPLAWGRYGPDDEVGALNHQTPQAVLGGVAEVRDGRAFSLALPICHPDGDPVWPGREPPVHTVEQDGAGFADGSAVELAGGFRSAVDALATGLHATTHVDALGHAWIGERAWNGSDATTAGPLTQASIAPIGRRGIVGRGVLLDVARYRDTDALAPGEAFGADVLDACAAQQATDIRRADVLILRTGWIGRYYREGADSFYRDFREPGLAYSVELAEWFDRRGVASLVTDTFGNEVSAEPETGLYGPVHIALLMRLGIVFTELAWVEDLAADCARDGRYAFLYLCAPLPVVGGTAAPANPIVVK